MNIFQRIKNIEEDFEEDSEVESEGHGMSSVWLGKLQIVEM